MDQVQAYQKFQEMKTEVIERKKKVMFVGIDIAKDSHVVCIGDNFGKCEKKVFTIYNKLEGYERFLMRISSISSDYDSVIFGVESSGGYERALSQYLHQKKYAVVRVPTISVKRERELETTSWHKNDPRDAKAVVRVMQRGVFQYYWFREKKWENIDALVRLNLHLTARGKTLQTMIRVNALPVVFPELSSYLKRLSTRFCETLLKHYPSPFHITEKGYETFHATIQKNISSKGSLGALKINLKEIYRLAQKSIGAPMNNGDAKTLELRFLAEQLEIVQRQKRQVRLRLKHLLETHEEYRLILTIPGIGKKTAPILINSIGDIRKFHHVNQLLNFWGINLAYYQSGKYEGQKKISKEGDKKVRTALWQCIQSIYFRPGNVFNEVWRRKSNDRKLTPIQTRKIKVMLMVKMARIIYVVLKSGTPYGAQSQGEEDRLSG